MRKVLYALCMLMFASPSFGQGADAAVINAVVAEGKMLYKLEKASWLGTDILREQYKEMANIGGYFSYFDNDTIKNLYYSSALSPKVIATICFDTARISNMKADFTERVFTKAEEDIFIIRTRALMAINEDAFSKNTITPISTLSRLSPGTAKRFLY